MLARLVGNVDFNSAFVLAVLFICACIALVAFLVNYRSKSRLKMQFDIDSQKLANEDAANKRQVEKEERIALTKIAVDKDVTFHRIDQGLIEGKVVE